MNFFMNAYMYELMNEPVTTKTKYDLLHIIGGINHECYQNDRIVTFLLQKHIQILLVERMQSNGILLVSNFLKEESGLKIRS